MSQVASPTHTSSRLSRRVGMSVCAAVLVAGLSASPALGSVSSLRQQAAAAAADAKAAKAKAEAAAQRARAAKGAISTTGAKVESAAEDVADSAEAAADAGVVLTDSEKKLGAAQKRLFALQQRLTEARDYDAELAGELAKAQAALGKAKSAVEAGQREVDAQQRVIGSVAREQFQQQGSLEGLTVVMGATSPGDLSQRVQWADTVFDTQAAEQARLVIAQTQLEASRQLQAQIEDRIAAAKAAAAAQVAVVSDLTKQAAAQEATVAALVAKHQAALDAAQDRLADDTRALNSAKSSQASAKARLAAAKKAIAAAKDDYADAQAEERQLQAEIKRALAIRSASSGSSGSSGSSSSSGSSGGGSGDSPRGTVSRYGFIRPLNASPGSPFGMRFHPILRIWRLHAGTDFGAACGTPIYAARSGRVIVARMTSQSGLYTVIAHGRIGGVSVTSGYSHQSKSLVRVGQRVSRGQLIGYVGNTGLSTTCHLHLDIRHNGVAVNPMRYVP